MLHDMTRFLLHFIEFNLFTLGMLYILVETIYYLIRSRRNGHIQKPRQN